MTDDVKEGKIRQSTNNPLETYTIYHQVVICKSFEVKAGSLEEAQAMAGKQLTDYIDNDLIPNKDNEASLVFEDHRDNWEIIDYDN